MSAKPYPGPTATSTATAGVGAGFNLPSGPTGAGFGASAGAGAKPNLTLPTGAPTTTAVPTAIAGLTGSASAQAQAAPVDLKTRLRTDFPGAFNTDADFTAAKSYSIASQGFRFRFDRVKDTLKTKVILISRKGGLLKPGLLASEFKSTTKEIVINNTVTNKPFLTLKFNDKTSAWDISNNEDANKASGAVKKTQLNEVRSVATDIGKIDFKCPIQKTGMCSSHKPSNLHNILNSQRFKTATFEENPNGEACKEDFELNVYYPAGCDLTEFISLIATTHVMALELH